MSSTPRSSGIPPGMFMRIIQDKQRQVAVCEKLLTMAKEEQDIEIIRHIHLDEKRHLGYFVNLYVSIFNEQPELLNPVTLQLDSFISGLKDSIMSELNLNIVYSSIIFTDTNQDVRNLFIQVMIDDNRHTLGFNYMYTKAVESKLT